MLVADLIATMAVATWGILYVKTDLKYLMIIAAITFGLALLVAMRNFLNATSEAWRSVAKKIRV